MAKSWKYSRSRKPLSLQDCKLRLTDAIKKTEEIIMTAKEEERQVVIQACHALSGLINRYARLYELTDFEERISALERKFEHYENHHTNGFQKPH